MDTDYSLNYGKNTYIITYKNKSGVHEVGEDALCKFEAERRFGARFPWDYKILNIQTPEEWIDETSTKIVKDLVKKFEESEKVESLVESSVI